MVLKDGQIIEQGNLKELLALDGVFASMWADQVSAAEDPAISLAADIIDKNVPVVVEHEQVDVDERATPEDLIVPPNEGYVVSTPEQPSTPDLSVFEHKEILSDIPSNTVAFPTSPVQDDMEEERGAEPQSMSKVVAVEDTPQQLVFPSSEPSEPQGSEIKPTPAVTFGSDVNPSRTDTPDPDSEPKRKRISSQNLQRLARRISISAKRQSSSMIPSISGLKRDSPRVSVDESGRDTDSATGSLKVDDKGKKKKDKKDKTRKGTS